MVWTKLPDDFDEQPAIADLSDAAYRLYVSGTSYCNRQLTDGYIPRGIVGTLVPSFRRRSLSELVAARLWVERQGGFFVSDFLKHQLSREEVLAAREQKRKAGRLGGLRSGEVRSAPEADREAPAEAGASAVARANPKPVPVPGPAPVPERSIDRRLAKRYAPPGNGLHHAGAAVAKVLASVTAAE